MIVSVENQAYVFLFSVAGGMLMAFIYDLFRIKRKTIRSFNLITYIEDLVYWIIVSLLIFLTVYISNDGQLRGFIFLGIAIGAVLYVMLLSRLVMKVSVAVLNFIGNVISTVFRIILLPLILLSRLLAYPVQMLWKLVRIIFKEIFGAIWHRISGIKKNRKKIKGAEGEAANTIKNLAGKKVKETGKRLSGKRERKLKQQKKMAKKSSRIGRQKKAIEGIK